MFVLLRQKKNSVHKRENKRERKHNLLLKRWTRPHCYESPFIFPGQALEVLFMLNRLHLACLKMTEVWIMNDLQPIQEVVIIEIIEKCTPCKICTERQLFQTIAVFSLWSWQRISPSLSSQIQPECFIFYSFIQFTSQKTGKIWIKL